MKLKRTLIGLTAETREALERLADLDNRSLSYIGAKLIEEGLARKRQEWREKQSLPSLQNGEPRRDTRKKRQQTAEDAAFEELCGK